MQSCFFTILRITTTVSNRLASYTIYHLTLTHAEHRNMRSRYSINRQLHMRRIIHIPEGVPHRHGEGSGAVMTTPTYPYSRGRTRHICAAYQVHCSAPRTYEYTHMYVYVRIHSCYVYTRAYEYTYMYTRHLYLYPVRHVHMSTHIYIGQTYVLTQSPSSLSSVPAHTSSLREVRAPFETEVSATSCYVTVS